jgi:tetratricopeptide (TPR) repeat protein
VRQFSRFVLVFMLAAALAAAQEPASPQQLFESGQNDQALQRIAQEREQGTLQPADAYLAGQVLVKVNRDDEARAEFERLATSGDPILSLVGQSAVAMVNNENERAVELATQAVAAGPESFQAHYQLGHAKSKFEDWAGCAEEFHQAATLNPTFAYAHYYAGLSYSRIKRADRTSEHFERFLKLAPNAPERAAVESLMRTLRGR